MTYLKEWATMLRLLYPGTGYVSASMATFTNSAGHDFDLCTIWVEDLHACGRGEVFSEALDDLRNQIAKREDEKNAQG
jgi:hypothetical protein